MKKRIIALFICALLALSIAPSAFAAKESVSSVPAGYTPIYTRADLVNVKNNLAGNYILMNDIALGGTYYGSWVPLGTSGNAFTGVFDGNSHVIRGLYINTTANYQGLFGFNCGTVKNLTVQGSVTGGEYVGGIVGASYKSSNSNTSISLSNLRNECTVTGTGNYVGGICGYCKVVTENASVTSYISHCTNAGTVKGYEKYVGGIVGANIAHVSSTTTKDGAASAYITESSNAADVSGKIIVGGICGTNQAKTERSNAKARTLAKIYMCSNSGKVTASSDAVAGICAVNDTTTYNIADAVVDRAFNSGAVTGSGIDAGGIVSRNQSESLTTAAKTNCTISNTYNRGAVRAKSYIGGIVAYNCANSEYGTCYSTVKNSYSTGTLGKGESVGGVVGYTYTGANISYSSGLSKVSKTVCTNTYYLAGTAAAGIGHGNGSATSVSATAIKGLYKTLGTTVWKEGTSYPEIKDMPVTNLYPTISGNITIDGTLAVGKTLWPKLSSLAPESATYTVKWFRDSKEVQTGRVYTLSEADYDKSIYCVIYATGRNRGTLVSNTVTMTREKLSGNITVNGTLAVGKTLWPNVSGLKPSGAAYTVKWFRDGKEVQTDKVYTLSEADYDKSIYCVIYGTGKYTGTLTTNTVTMTRDKIGGSVVISGEMHLGKTLTLDTSKITPKGAKYTVKWYRDGKAVSDKNTYTLGEADLTHELYATVTGTGAYLGSITSPTVKFNRTKLDGKLTFSQIAEYGNTLSVVLSNKEYTVSYEWKLDDKVVSTSDKFYLEKDAIGKLLTVTAIGHGEYEGSLSANARVQKRTVNGTIVLEGNGTKYGECVKMRLEAINIPADYDYKYYTRWLCGGEVYKMGESVVLPENSVGSKFTPQLVIDDSEPYYRGTVTGPSVTCSSWSNPFLDIFSGAWYENSVRYAYENGLFSGTAEHSFSPETKMTRAMFVTVLSRLDGADTDNTAETGFTDVPKGKWYAGAVRWAAENGITSGTSQNRFSPDTPISREQMCTMLKRYADYSKTTLEAETEAQPFEDENDVSSYAKESVKLMHDIGLISGKTETKFMPGDSATRAEVATILKRYCEYAK